MTPFQQGNSCCHSLSRCNTSNSFCVGMSNFSMQMIADMLTISRKQTTIRSTWRGASSLATLSFAIKVVFAKRCAVDSSHYLVPDVLDSHVAFSSMFPKCHNMIDATLSRGLGSKRRWLMNSSDCRFQYYRKVGSTRAFTSVLGDRSGSTDSEKRGEHRSSYGSEGYKLRLSRLLADRAIGTRTQVCACCQYIIDPLHE